MNPIRRWNQGDYPINWFKNELESVFQRFFEDPFFSPGPFRKENGQTSPVLNVEEKSDHYTIEAEIPGVNANDIELDLDGRLLTIKGEREEEVQTEDNQRKMHLVERSYGSFQRSITLPDNADLDGITAESRNGVLYINIPKDRKSKPRRINVKDRDHP